MTPDKVQKTLEEIALNRTMIKYDVSYKMAKLLHAYPDIRLGKKVEDYQTQPY